MIIKKSKLMLAIHSLLLVMIGGACQSTETVSTTNDAQPLKYFDLSRYMNTEVERLSKSNTTVQKTVEVNGDSETKTLSISSWQTELSSFFDSDINKPAWINSYQADSIGDDLTYIALEENLKTRSLKISRDSNDQIISIEILNKSSNLLYESEERLSYYPDSLYEVIKTQTVKIVGKNEYRITGLFN